MAEVKGILVTGIRTFLIERYGKSAVDHAVTMLVPNEQALIQKRFLESSFYPYATMDAMGNLARALGPIRKTTGQELGKWLAEYVFKGAYKPLLAHEVVPMVEKIGFIKDFFYRDANMVDSKMTGNASSVLVYRYVGGVRPTPGTCRSLGSFWGHALELAGGVKVTTSHPLCVAEGADRCEFRYAW